MPLFLADNAGTKGLLPSLVKFYHRTKAGGNLNLQKYLRKISEIFETD